MGANKFSLFVGPCVIESEGLTLEIAQEVKRQLGELDLDLVFKASFDKANRTSIESYRGPGLEVGLEILEKVKGQTSLPVLTDIHTSEQASQVASVVDVIQVPAFLCRQTDLLLSAAEACVSKDRRLNVKKGQFLAPWDAKNIVEKLGSAKGFDLSHFTLTERGVSFGYNNLVVDMRSFACLSQMGVRSIYDATHSIQTPGAGTGGKSTGGQREYLEVLARAAVAAGANGLFMEVHPDPSKAKSDGPNAFYLDRLRPFVEQMISISTTVSKLEYQLPEAPLRYN